MKKTAVITLFLVLGLFTGTSYAAEVTLFRPKQYLRATGAPGVYTATFRGITREGRLIISNGDEDGEHRISSGLILVNGEQVFGPSDFSQQVYRLKTPINLTEDNLITVELRSGPGGYLTVEVTQKIPIELSIISPLEGDKISRPDVTVQGAITNPTRNDTGVTVNGILAVVYGDKFVANHVPLEEGENVLIVVATDADGYTAETAITVYAETTGDYITLVASTESGVSPLETTLRIEGSFTFTESSLTGPAEVDIFEIGPEEYRVRMKTEGIYYLKAVVKYAESKTYTDTVAIQVLSEAEVDALLRAKWEGIRQGLAQSDIDSAVSYFSESSKEDYREMFTLLSDNLSQIEQELGDIQFIGVMRNSAEYDIRIIRDGVEYSFYLLFVKDEDGLWKIRCF